MTEEMEIKRMLTDEERLEVMTQLEKTDEGLKQFAYKDSLGNLTIGIGRNLDARGISPDEARFLCMNDIDITDHELCKILPWVKYLPKNYRFVLVNMGFQLGIPKLLTFKRMIECMKNLDSDGSSKELLDSKYATQVPNRANRLAYMLIKGGV